MNTADEIGNVRSVAASGVDMPALVAALIAPMAWGLTGVFVKLLGGLPTQAIVAGRLLVAFLVLLPWVLLRWRRLAPALRTPVTVAMGAYYLLATEAFVRAPVVDVCLIVGLAPVVALLIERAKGRHPRRAQWFGAAGAVAGLALFLRPWSSTAETSWLGDALALGAAVVSAGYAAGLRARAMAGRGLDPIASTAASCLFGALVAMVLLLVEGQAGAWQIGPSKAGLLVLLGLVSTALPTLSYAFASGRLAPAITTSFGLLTPMFAALMAGLFLGEWPPLVAVPGAVLVLLGLLRVLR